MEIILLIMIAVCVLLIIAYGNAFNKKDVAEKCRKEAEEKLAKYLQYGDIYEYAKNISEKMGVLDSLTKDIEKSRQHLMELMEKHRVMRGIEQLEYEREYRNEELKKVQGEINKLRVGRETEKRALEKVINDRLLLMDEIIADSAKEASEKISQIEYNPIDDEQEFVIREEMKLKLAEAVKDAYNTEAFSKEYTYKYKDEKVFNMSVSMSALLMLYADMLIDKKIGNPYKKGLSKSMEIIDQCVKTLWRRFGSYAISENNHYVQKKREYIKCVYEIEQYKAQKAEERKEMLQAQREEMAAQKEIEREIKRAKKDEQDAQEKLEKRRMELAVAKSDAEIARLNEQIARLQTTIQEAQQREEKALTMAQQGRAGHVYIISNIGSFGEDVYKIGMTRRTEPMDRIVELGDASVPFPFDVHAMIWTEDAPGLETALHHAFEDRRLNAINGRKEFFHVTIDEVRKVLDGMNIEYQLVENPLASQYRDTLAIRDK